MVFSELNWWAILVAVVAGQAVGALWYSPLLFANAWMKAIGTTLEKLKANPSKMPFVVSWITGIVLAITLAVVLRMLGGTTLVDGIWMGLVIGIGLGVMASSPHYAFGGLTLNHWLIDAGHMAATVVVMSAIIGVWP